MDFTLYNKANQALDWLLPRKCLVCEEQLAQKEHPCCMECYQNLPFQDNYCRQCGQAFAQREETCGRCINSPPHYDACFCPFEYASPISEQICTFKYNERPDLAKSIAQLLAKEVKEQAIVLPKLLIPVPMHVSRLRKRGFNQSTLIARQLSKIFEIPLLTDAVRKKTATPPQAQQSLKQRQKNLKNSFILKKSVKAQSVAIIDDVVTTGSTAGEIAKILKKNGVDYIQIWGVTHTL